jgi:hypothetical protein
MGLAFGLNLPTAAADGADPAGMAVRAEELGFDFPPGRPTRPTGSPTT